MKAKNKEQFIDIWSNHLNWMGTLYGMAGKYDEWPEERKRIRALIVEAADNEFPPE